MAASEICKTTSASAAMAVILQKKGSPKLNCRFLSAKKGKPTNGWLTLLTTTLVGTNEAPFFLLKTFGPSIVKAIISRFFVEIVPVQDCSFNPPLEKILRCTPTGSRSNQGRIPEIGLRELAINTSNRDLVIVWENSRTHKCVVYTDASVAV
jgi:hypothetical protein